MCGILGGWGSIDRESVKYGLDAMVHRGPDSEGIWFSDGADPLCVAMRRLAIIDLEGGDQPIFSEDKQLILVCNGEIYNHCELMAELKAIGHRFRSRSDAECILHAYEEDPQGFVSRLRGMFGFAIIDLKRRRLVLGRDRFGKKAIYYTRDQSGGFYFASEIRALKMLLKKCRKWHHEVDESAVSDYLSFGAVPQPKTIYKGVFVVPPAALMIFDGKNEKIVSYWAPSSEKVFDGTYDDAQVAVREKIQESVAVRLRSDVPVGVFLSAGLDSSIVSYAAAQRLGSKLESFTVASDHPEFDESPVAKRTAARLGIRNTVLKIDYDPAHLVDRVVKMYGQPFADPSAMPSLAISDVAAEHVKVILNGDGGDELFGGYRRYQAAKLLPLLNMVPSSISKIAQNYLSGYDPKRRSLLGFVKRLTAGAGCNNSSRYLQWTTDMMRDSDKEELHLFRGHVSSEKWLESIYSGKGDPVRALMNADIRINLLSVLLVKIDIATMAHSLEGRSPFLDHELGELALSLPSAMLIRKGKGKIVLRDAYRGYLSEEVLTGTKRGFEIPLYDWIKGCLSDRIQDSVCGTDSRLSNYFDRRTLQAIVTGEKFSDRNWAYVVYSLLVLELWLRENG
ncbi:asparagine synthase (glutamine-hydrolyzing) [Verrucomicrobia bacterium]|nr:asparagine synthase (glutamine-hydrolyzing) [Verrucomicrobiota bacterium]